MIKTLHIFLLITVLTTCSDTKKKKLPFLGRHIYTETSKGTDTTFHTIKPFSFIDQDSAIITNATYAGKIYVSDFFFMSCPSICPLMKVQMLRVYNKYLDNPAVGILSHSIDPENDNVPALKEYAKRLGVISSKWHFITGERDSIYKIGQTSYYIGIRDNGSFEHSGKFVLIDKEKRIRGVYEGTEQASVSKLLEDMDILLKE